MIETFPPAGNGSGQFPAAHSLGFDVSMVDGGLLASDRREADLIEATLSAFDHLDDRYAELHSLPSLGAISLLVWARQHRTVFYQQVYQRALVFQEKRLEREPPLSRNDDQEWDGIVYRQLPPSPDDST